MLIDKEDIPEAVLVVDDNIQLLSINITNTANTEIEIAIPLNDDTHPELLVRDSKCALYKFCCVFPLSCLAIILIVYYSVK